MTTIEWKPDGERSVARARGYVLQVEQDWTWEWSITHASSGAVVAQGKCKTFRGAIMAAEQAMEART